MKTSCEFIHSKFYLRKKLVPSAQAQASKGSFWTYLHCNWILDLDLGTKNNENLGKVPIIENFDLEKN